MSATHDLARWRALTPRERRDLAVCAAAMPFVVTGLRLLGLARVRAAFATFPMLRKPRAARAAEEAAARARSLARTVGIAARRGPVHGNCLARSVLLHGLLEREGIVTELRLGVTRDEGTFAAHAWVERDGEPLNDAADVTTRYGAFERDFAARPGSPR